MQLITHQSHLDALPESPLKSHVQARFDQLSEDTDVPPNLVFVESEDDITGPDYAFVSVDNGLIGDGETMSSLVQNISDQEIAQIADYLAGQK